jgi:HD superfamily phosphodiesterase
MNYELSKEVSMEQLIGTVLAYFHNVRSGEHAVKVYAYAAGIGREEALPPAEYETLKAAAILHDIGIPEAMRIHGSGAGPFQEREGAKLVPHFLEEAGVTGADKDRVVWLVGHHHTEEKAGEDRLLQILMEADYLVNLAEGGLKDTSPQAVRDSFFRTEAGKRYITALFGVE